LSPSSPRLAWDAHRRTQARRLLRPCLRPYPRRAALPPRQGAEYPSETFRIRKDQRQSAASTNNAPPAHRRCLGQAHDPAPRRRMIAPENPPGFIVRTEAQKAAWDNGYRLERGVLDGRLRYVSTTAPGAVWIAGASPHGPWLLSIDHAGITAEIGALSVLPGTGPGLATFLLATSSQLHAALDRVYKPSACPTRRSPAFAPRRRPGANDRGRASGDPACRTGHIPRCPHGLLGWPLPADRHCRRHCSVPRT
jgi:hypothetical protein